MSDFLFGFIGVGNMGGALAKAAGKTLMPEQILVSSRTMEKAAAFSAQLGCHAADNATIAAKCRYLFLGVKPQAMATMLAGIAPVLAARTDRFVLVSMAAGLTMEQIRTMAGGIYPVIRMMPNTPASIGAGMILYTATEDVTESERREFADGLAAAGRFDVLPEALIDAGSAVSGCGPAFVYLFIEALADGGVECGLPRIKALEYAAQTVCGAAQMVLESGQHPGALKDAVCSPGGTTIAGVHALEHGAFRANSMDAVCAAYEKSKAFSR
ncbi:MAG: pyrroline-5-carboxylate reductase [Oscillospiraceae bacterium]|jgi:pyrroline-5-carboxylate reductase